ncbi:hypothetical protein CFC21_018554 [Triticum aestivum]|uniref:LisH domain-containing protein n=2 Tax=Triticum aestivum TaxID=4565 RepID=A0A9R1J3S5_WHEAT|nr:uncharacterized protein LOC119356186 isoform X2 [Triticum dicoccoides]XP_044458697.1 uncharacterized protein LOC123190167 isoform X2 [Triticum aestivum]KAF7003190.1 hypothetical protein CFC21_018554 [Triticum aestivum]
MSSFAVVSDNGDEDACVGENSVVVPVKSEEDARKGEASVVVSGEGEGTCKGKASVMVSGKGKDAVKPSCTAQYPCVKRLRERRLLSFLLDQGFDGAFRELNRETGVLFNVEHIRRLVRRGQWDDALMYLNTFLPPFISERRSFRARIFNNFLLMHHRFANVVAGNKDMHLDKQYADGRSSSTRAERRFRSMNYSILAPDSGHLRAAIDWDKVRSHAACLIPELAHRTPELKRRTVLPSRCMMPHDVLPIGTGLFLRRRVKKQGPQPPKTDAIITAIKHQRYCRLVRDSSIGSKDEALELLVNYLDQTLQAGLPRGCTLSYDFQPSGKEGAPICQIISGTLKVHAENPGISTPTNAGTKRLIQEGYHTHNQMDGLPTVEDDIEAKRQRTTGTFGEKSSVPAFGGRASTDANTLVNFRPKLRPVCSM